MPLERTAYTVSSTEKIVRKCLLRKQSFVRKKEGIGPHSCWSCVEFLVRGQRRYAYGNSQFLNPVAEGIYRRPYVRCHGEKSAVMRMLERCQLDLEACDGRIEDLVSRIYIELSPCEECGPFLLAIKPGLEILYSWLYPDERDEWQDAARALCS
jgi:hypothetical protein